MPLPKVMLVGEIHGNAIILSGHQNFVEASEASKHCPDPEATEIYQSLDETWHVTRTILMCIQEGKITAEQALQMLETGEMA